MKNLMIVTRMLSQVLVASALISAPATMVLAQSHDHAVHATDKVSHEAILNTYAEQAYHLYSVSLQDAKALQQAIDAFVAKPTEESFATAKKAWLASRESYGLTETFRLSNGPIDAEDGWVEKAYGALESQINAWPLDEYMIDYTLDAKGKRTSGNIIDSTGRFMPQGEGAKAVDVTEITPEVITELNENGGEANVTSGYHAIEFLLWGQDQDYNNFVEDKVTHGATIAGQRPLSDYTTDKLAQRRIDYLKAAADKLVDDVATVTEAWAPSVDGDKGLYRAALLGKLTGKDVDKNIPAQVALKQIVAGMGVYMKSELANERIAVAVLTPSEEDEHSCFSDNTHRDIHQNFVGFVDVLKGTQNGKKIGPALYDTLSTSEKAQIDTLISSIEERIEKMNSLVSTMHFDYQIKPENAQAAKNIIAMKNTMRKLGDQMIVVGQAVGVKLNTDDVTDSEETKL